MVKKVDCINCIEFTPPEFKEPLNLISIIKVNAKCKLGKRVMFRTNGLHPDSSNWECGWFRYCEDFNDKVNDNI